MYEDEGGVARPGAGLALLGAPAGRGAAGGRAAGGAPVGAGLATRAALGDHRGVDGAAEGVLAGRGGLGGGGGLLRGGRALLGGRLRGSGVAVWTLLVRSGFLGSLGDIALVSSDTASTTSAMPAPA